MRTEKVRALEQYGMNLIFGYEITKNSFEEIQKCIGEQRLDFYYYQA